MVNQILREIINTNGIEIFGSCDFDKVKDKIINCAAKSDLPHTPKRIISFAFPYKVTTREKNNISLYAVVKDYHTVIGKILKNISLEMQNKFPQNSFASFVDNSPIPEVFTAALCGLGVIGENGLLITEKYGSWVFIGEIVTDLEFPVENHKIRHCIKCFNCKKACPSKSIPGSKKNCASAISQKKGTLTKEEKIMVKKTGLIFGCDTCQIICPMNKNKKDTNIKEFIDSAIPIITKENCSTIKDRAFLWRPIEVILRNINLEP